MCFMKIKTLLFDIDGTLLDTTEFIYQAFEYSLLKNKIDLTRKEVKKIMGKPLRECYSGLTGLSDVSVFVKYHTEFQIENFHLSLPYPNALKTLKTLKKRGFKIGAITSRSKHTAKITMDNSGLSKYIEYFLTIDDVVNPKPHPEALIKAMKYFASSPSETVMVGDSPIDIMAGKNAGTKTIGALYGFHGKMLKKYKPDFLVKDVYEITSCI